MSIISKSVIWFARRPFFPEIELAIFVDSDPHFVIKSALRATR